MIDLDPMESIHTFRSRWRASSFWLVILMILAWFLAACSPPQKTQALISVSIKADSHVYQVQLPSGSNVQDAMNKAQITVSNLDRIEPPAYTVVSDGSSITIVRIREEFEIEQVTIPFERQVVQNESLPVGENRLSQPGVNGVQEITYRRVFEDGVETSRSEVKSVILKEAVPEITMVGIQTPFASVPIPGRLAYLSGGNAWLMEENTGNRRAVITTGDLDGRVFCLSPDGKWLLFTRNTGAVGTINSLWTIRLDTTSSKMIDLKATNIQHFARWSPDSGSVAYSTVEPRSAAPGWQANNDLFVITVSSGYQSKARKVLEANSGGVYGWWGMDFAWMPDGKQLLYARPDGVGLVDAATGKLASVLDLLPFQTGADWAWVPGIGLDPTGNLLYTVNHTAPKGATSPEVSRVFNLEAVPLGGGAPVQLVSQVGMFAYPVVSPLESHSTDPTVEKSSQVAYLQALVPDQSDTSKYQLVVMDRDGSNKHLLFPEEGAPGLDPQPVVWSPSSLVNGDAFAIAVVYQNNIWLINGLDGKAQQITGDGLTGKMDWR